jgi:hypothetical protein
MEDLDALIGRVFGMALKTTQLGPLYASVRLPVNHILTALTLLRSRWR